MRAFLILIQHEFTSCLDIDFDECLPSGLDVDTTPRRPLSRIADCRALAEFVVEEIEVPDWVFGIQFVHLFLVGCFSVGYGVGEDGWQES